MALYFAEPYKASKVHSRIYQAGSGAGKLPPQQLGQVEEVDESVGKPEGQLQLLKPPAQAMVGQPRRVSARAWTTHPWERWTCHTRFLETT